jgi:hypothetical protein
MRYRRSKKGGQESSVPRDLLHFWKHPQNFWDPGAYIAMKTCEHQPCSLLGELPAHLPVSPQCHNWTVLPPAADKSKGACQNPFLFFFNFIIHMCIQGLGHFSPLPPPPPLPPTLPLPSPPHPLNTQHDLLTLKTWSLGTIGWKFMVNSSWIYVGDFSFEQYD